MKTLHEVNLRDLFWPLFSIVLQTALFTLFILINDCLILMKDSFMFYTHGGQFSL
jgi:hypothetical protein